MFLPPNGTDERHLSKAEQDVDGLQRIVANRHAKLVTSGVLEENVQISKANELMKTEKGNSKTKSYENLAAVNEWTVI